MLSGVRPERQLIYRFSAFSSKNPIRATLKSYARWGNRVQDGLAYTLSSFLPMATCRINQKMAFESDRISALLFP